MMNKETKLLEIDNFKTLTIDLEERKTLQSAFARKDPLLNQLSVSDISKKFQTINEDNGLEIFKNSENFNNKEIFSNSKIIKDLVYLTAVKHITNGIGEVSNKVDEAYSKLNTKSLKIISNSYNEAGINSVSFDGYTVRTTTSIQQRVVPLLNMNDYFNTSLLVEAGNQFYADQVSYLTSGINFSTGAFNLGDAGDFDTRSGSVLDIPTADISQTAKFIENRRKCFKVSNNYFQLAQAQANQYTYFDLAVQKELSVMFLAAQAKQTYLLGSKGILSDEVCTEQDDSLYISGRNFFDAQGSVANALKIAEMLITKRQLVAYSSGLVLDTLMVSPTIETCLLKPIGALSPVGSDSGFMLNETLKSYLERVVPGLKIVKNPMCSYSVRNELENENKILNDRRDYVLFYSKEDIIQKDTTENFLKVSPLMDGSLNKYTYFCSSFTKPENTRKDAKNPESYNNAIRFSVYPADIKSLT